VAHRAALDSYEDQPRNSDCLRFRHSDCVDANSTVCIIPLSDQSVADFAKSYPTINEAAAKLRKLDTVTLMKGNIRE
jgi:hypothetical protein